MEQDARQRGYQQVIPDKGPQLATAVLEEPQGFHNVQMADLFNSCHDILSIGLALAWGLCNAKTVSCSQGHSWFFDSIFNSGAWLRARRARQALPICEGDFAEMIGELRRVPLAVSRERRMAAKMRRNGLADDRMSRLQLPDGRICSYEGRPLD